MLQLMYSFQGQRPPRQMLDRVRQGKIGAFCLFGHLNGNASAQIRELTDILLSTAREGGQLPPIIGIDQEGGQLIAVTGGSTELPGNMALGATRSPELAAKAGYVLGRELLAMGVNMNFAPALDVNVNPANPVIGIRSFGDNSQLVADLGTALITGMQGVGVMATAKHFPGHGDTETDTHSTLPVVAHSLKRMNEVELLPFKAAIQAGVAATMTAHVSFPSLDDQFPATVSEKVLDQFLRRTLGFKGLILTDAMDMSAVARMGHVESVRAAMQAGADLVLLGHIPDQLGLTARLNREARTDALIRLNTARARIPVVRPSFDVIGCTEHQQIAQEIADRSITVVQDGFDTGRARLPLQPSPNTRIAVITPHPVDLTPADTSSFVQIQLAQALRRRHQNVLSYEMPYGATSGDVAAVLNAVEDAQIVIVGTISAENDPAQGQLVRALADRGQSPIVIALRTPYDLLQFPMIDTYLCAYGIRAVTMEAVARVLFGEIEARGVLPCVLPITIKA